MHAKRLGGPENPKSPLVSGSPSGRTALVIGAGLSGSAVAHSLARRGWSVTVLDSGHAPGAGASGLPVGLAAPHVSPDDNVLSRITRAGVQATLQRAKELLNEGTDWALTGVLEHNLAGKRRLPAAQANDHAQTAHPAHPTQHAHPSEPAHPGHLNDAMPWPPIDSRPATAEQVAAAGLPPGTPALWHAHAGWIRPTTLVAAQLNTPGVKVVWGQTAQFIALEDVNERPEECIEECPQEGSQLGPNKPAIWRVRDAAGRLLGEAPFLVVASAYDSLNLLRPLPGFAVPLNPLRGQISYGHLNDLSLDQRQKLPPFPVNGHGSFISHVPTPHGEPGWFIGSTFERQCEQAPVREEDHAANHLRLATLLPHLGAALQSQFAPPHVRGWAGVRCTLPNRLPAVGPVHPKQLPGLWLCAGMGARGISLSVLCGELLAARLENEALPLADSLAKHLAAERYATT